jgi:acetylornithine deacetylase/succinyl-diaminopimelate desuccinylase-like protein
VARRELPPGVRALTEWLAIPSVSGSQHHAADVWRAARWVAAWLRALTPEVQVTGGGHGPVVVARLRSGVHRPGDPFVVVYGHLDVKPAGPGWTNDPFSPIRRGPRLVARGASDDKGQLMAHLVALRAWTHAGGVPGDVVVVVDGAEEVESPGLAEALEQHRRGLLRGDAVSVLVSDTRAAAPGVPSLTLTQRGLLTLTVATHTGGPPVHAGRLGGAVLDPAVELASRLPAAARAAAALRSNCSARTDPQPDGTLARALDGRVVHSGRLVERSTRRGAVSITGWDLLGGPGVVASCASATLDVRIPPGVSPQDAETVIRRALTAGARMRVDVRRAGGTDALCVHLPAPVLQAVQRACLDGYGVPPRLLGSGGSIAAVAIMRRIFPGPPILLGIGPVDDGAHGPDEYLHLPDWANGVLSSVGLLHALFGKRVLAGGSGSAAARSCNTCITCTAPRQVQPCHGPSETLRVSVPELPRAPRT